MKKIISFVFVLQLAILPAFSMSRAEKATAPVSPEIKQSVSQICEGNFIAAGEIAKKVNGENSQASKILAIVEDYNKLDKTIKEKREKAYQELIAQLKKFEAEEEAYELSKKNPKTEETPKNEKSNGKGLFGKKSEPNSVSAEPNEPNEPNLLEVFPVIVKARDYATESEKASVLEIPYVKKTIERAKKAAAEYQSKGDYLDALLFCYSWLAALYEDDKSYTEIKEQLEDKAIIKTDMKELIPKF